MTGRAVMGKTGIFNTYRSGLLREAEQLAGKRLPLWTFWLPISTLVNAKGQVSYTDTGHGSLDRHETYPRRVISQRASSARASVLWRNEALMSAIAGRKRFWFAESCSLM